MICRNLVGIQILMSIEHPVKNVDGFTQKYVIQIFGFLPFLRYWDANNSNFSSLLLYILNS